MEDIVVSGSCREISILERLDWQYLTRYLDVHFVVLFGSALSDAESYRDIDLLVVSPDFSHIFYLKQKDIVRGCLGSAEVDPVCLTPAAFKACLDRKDPLLQRILATGRIVHAKPLR